jgi:hypothetical protein
VNVTVSVEHRSHLVIVGLLAAFLIVVSACGWLLQAEPRSIFDPQLLIRVAVVGSALLMLALGRSHFGSWWFAILAVAVFATTPLLLRAVNGSTAALLQMPFVMAWLMSIEQWRKSANRLWVVVSGAVLALGLYSHPAGLVMMPIYLALTIVGLISVDTSYRRIADLILAFAVVAAPWVLLLWQHPSYIEEQVTTHRLYDAQRFTLLQGMREMSSWVGLTARSEVYWDYFNPAFLFFSRTGLAASVPSPQVFLTPLCVLMPIGLYHVATQSSLLVRWMLIGGLLSAPIPGALTAQPPIATRFTTAIPFAALLAAYGIATVGAWLRQRTRRTIAEFD